MPPVTAIVPATDRPSSLEQVLAAIGRAADGPEELLVIREPRGTGPAAARNAGARAAGGEVLVFIDSDVEVHPDVFSRVREAFEARPDLVALFGAYDDDPAAPGAVSGFRNLLHHHVHAESPGEARTFWAGLGAIRRDAFLAVGGFDEARYQEPSIEDIELGGRLAALGMRIELDPAIRGTHLKAWSLRQMVETDLRRRGIPWTMLILDGASPTGTLNLGPRHRASLLATAGTVVACIFRRPGMALAFLTAFVGLNRRLYGLILRQRGALQALQGIALHLVHHLTGGVAVVAGTGLWVRERLRARIRRNDR